MIDEVPDNEALLASARMVLRRVENLGRAAQTRQAELELLDQIARARSVLEGVVERLGAGDGTHDLHGHVARRMLGQALQHRSGGADGAGAIDLYSGSAPRVSARTLASRELEKANRSRVATIPEGEGVPHLSGSSAVVALTEVLELLASQGKTGIMEVDTGKEQITLHLRHGKLVHASSDGAPEGDRLGDLLVSMGFVTRDRLTSFLQGFAGSGRLLGEILATGSVVSAEELQAALAEQVQRQFNRLFEAADARYRFTPADVDSGEFQRVDLGLRFLLFESARHLDQSRAELG